MANTQGTSFIPQRPIRGAQPRGVRKIYVLTYVSYIVFFAAIIAAGATALYNFSLEKQLASLQSQLAAERDQFKESDMVSVKELERRIGLAQERLNKHLSVVSIFDALEQSAAQPIRYLGFTFDRPNDEAPTLTLVGQSANFNNILFQRQVMEANPILAGATFSPVELKAGESPEGGIEEVINFTLTKSVDDTLIPFTRTLINPASIDAMGNVVNTDGQSAGVPESLSTGGDQASSDAPQEEAQDAQGAQTGSSTQEQQ